MTWFDYAVLGILGFSLLIGVLRGFARELVSLIGWVAAFILATLFSSEAARRMPESLGPMLGGLFAYLAIFVGVLLIAFFVGLVMSLLLRAAGLGAADRMLGAVFGLVRGALVVFVGVMLAGLTPLPQEAFWKRALLSGPIETGALALRPMLPEGISQRLKYR